MNEGTICLKIHQHNNTHNKHIKKRLMFVLARAIMHCINMPHKTMICDHNINLNDVLLINIIGVVVSF